MSEHQAAVHYLTQAACFSDAAKKASATGLLELAKAHTEQADDYRAKGVKLLADYFHIHPYQMFYSEDAERLSAHGWDKLSMLLANVFVRNQAHHGYSEAEALERLATCGARTPKAGVQ